MRTQAALAEAAPIAIPALCKPEAVVTAGGTSEAIDDVRVITNNSGGRFGHAIAEALANEGASVHELCAQSAAQHLPEDPRVRYSHFVSAEDLRQLLHAEEQPNIVFHAAAVADYTPEPTSGKIRSDLDEINLRLQRNPKIIASLREAYGQETFLVGFKLLSNVPEAELIAAATKLIKTNRLNMVVANDLRDIHDGQHPVIAVTPEGGAIPFTGHRKHVAKQLVRFALRRMNVDWYRSSSDEALSGSSEEQALFTHALALAHHMNLLTDESGNVSASLRDNYLTVSPRQVDKSQLSSQDAIEARVDHDARQVTFQGERKPSIDTGVSSYLYETFPEIEALLHFHNGWGRMDTTTQFPYPCGVRQEADEIIRALEQKAPGSFGVELLHHGFLLGLAERDIARLEDEWEATLTDFAEHVHEVSPGFAFPPHLLRPIFDGAHVAGVIYDNPGGAAVFLREEARGSGIGDHVVNQLINRGYSIETIDACQVRNFYKRYGFIETYDVDRKLFNLAAPKKQ